MPGKLGEVRQPKEWLCGWMGEWDTWTHTLRALTIDPGVPACIPCKYARVGCEEKLLRKDVKNEVQLHFQVTTEKVLYRVNNGTSNDTYFRTI